MVIKNLLNPEQLARCRAGCGQVLSDMLRLPSSVAGRKYCASGPGRLACRYSFGDCSGSSHMVHHPAWAMLADLESYRAILEEIYGGADWAITGSGGDFSLPVSCQSYRCQLAASVLAPLKLLR